MTSRQSFLCICLGVTVTLCVYGYQFGHSNHNVYLLDALRRTEPPVLANDWFTTQTLQYHVLFTWITEPLMRLGITAPAFALIYVMLVLLFHIAWLGIIRQIGGDEAAYLISVALYHLSAAGTGLGMYQFFQDSSLVPSNIANVVLLVGIWLWMIDRFTMAGACFGIAGLFHLNYALVGIGLWIVLNVSMFFAPSRRKILIGTLLAIVPSAINLALAARFKLQRSGAIPLREFIELYVKLRHPHHYDPSSWPIGIWLAFGWTIVPGIILLRDKARRVFVIFLSLNLAALVGAGIWYISETLVQLSLYRFSIYVQLLGCAAAGGWIARALSRERLVFGIGTAACATIALTCMLRGPFYGLFQMPEDDAAYQSLCRWVTTNTPVDAVFLVPPDEQSMRFMGKRAIVVNYKCMPQLSAELILWRDRMQDVLALTDLRDLPRGFATTLAAIHRRYDELTWPQLESTATKYSARYIVSTRAMAGHERQLLFTTSDGRYNLYDLGANPNVEKRY